MLVSSMPCRGRSPLIGVAGLVVERGVLMSAECPGMNGWGVAVHSDELLPGDEPAALSQRDQFADPVAVAGDGEGLPVLDGVHDLPRPRPQIALRDLRECIHALRLLPRATRCYIGAPRCLLADESRRRRPAGAAHRRGRAGPRHPPPTLPARGPPPGA